MYACFQANVTRTNHIMWTMGTDFRYQYANSWFRQMDKFIHYVNLVIYLYYHYIQWFSLGHFSLSVVVLIGSASSFDLCLLYFFGAYPQDGRVNALYSTPSIYTGAKYAANEEWPLKSDDFFPWVSLRLFIDRYRLHRAQLWLWHKICRYADHPNAYWTGYFTSRPALKGYVRVMSGYYQVKSLASSTL